MAVNQPSGGFDPWGKRAAGRVRPWDVEDGSGKDQDSDGPDRNEEIPSKDEEKIASKVFRDFRPRSKPKKVKRLKN